MSESCCSHKAKKPETGTVREKTPGAGLLPRIGRAAFGYAPVIGVFGLALAGAFVLTLSLGGGFMAGMHYAMGLGMLNFSLLKMGNIPAFADAFGRYDLAAGKFRAYGLSYPFIEAGLGLLYLAHAALGAGALGALYAVTAGLMAFGTLGIVRALKHGGGDLKCACVGGDRDLPLSRVAVAENTAAGGMALIMLAFLAF